MMPPHALHGGGGCSRPRRGTGDALLACSTRGDASAAGRKHLTRGVGEIGERCSCDGVSGVLRRRAVRQRPRWRRVAIRRTIFHGTASGVTSVPGHEWCGGSDEDEPEGDVDQPTATASRREGALCRRVGRAR